jgi:hypothetical protein
MFKEKSRFGAVLMLLYGLSACGGGGAGEGTATGPSCDMNAELATAPRTAPFAGYLQPDNYAPVVTQERWPLVIQGEQHTLSVIVSLPSSGQINGVVFTAHGIDTNLANADPQRMRSEAELHFARRGYASVYVARRGYFGSTGDLSGTTALKNICQTDGLDCTRASLAFLGADMIAAMEFAARDARLGGLMLRTILLGGSGGAEAVLAASDSAIFKSIPTKAIIRVHGTNSRDFDTFVPFQQKYWAVKAEQGPRSHRSLWLVGDQDQTTSPRFLACEFRAFSQASGFPNSFAVVPGWNHGVYGVLFTPAVLPVVAKYLRDEGFPGF